MDTQMGEKSIPPWLLYAIPCFYIIYVVYAFFIFDRWEHPFQALAIADALFTLPLIPGCALCWYVVACRPDLRSVWAIAFQQSFYILGSLVWNYIEIVLHEKPYPSLADAFYILSSVSLIIAMVWFPQRKRSSLDLTQQMLDVAIVVVSVVIFSWHFILQPTLASF